jgi:ribosomal protein S6
MSKTMKKVAVEVVTGGGIVRGIHNHGFRDLAHRFKAKFADKEGKRYYEIGRFISIYYDANPATMRGVEQILKLDEEILRNTHLRARSVLDISRAQESIHTTRSRTRTVGRTTTGVVVVVKYAAATVTSSTTTTGREMIYS